MNQKIRLVLILGVILLSSFFIFNNVKAGDLVNINTATLEELDGLPGIGPSKAQAIIDYRELNGLFVVIEDIMQVSGIGQATFDGLKDLITVGDSNGGQVNEIKIVINEMLPNPAGSDDNEWIELKNIGVDSVDLMGWQIGDLTKKYTIVQEDFGSTVISAGGFFILKRTTTKIALNNNGGETVNLYDNNSNLVNTVSYSENAKDDISWARDENGNYSWTTSLTQGSKNIIVGLPDEISSGSSSSSSSGSGGTSNKSRYEDIIIFNEIMINPLGIDDNEWIELYNTSKDSVSLVGWKIKDNTDEFKIVDVFLKANEILVLPKSKTGITLNNIGGDQLELIDNNGHQVDKLSYKKKVAENEDYSWCQELNKWLWGLETTQGESNICPPKNKDPVAYFEIAADEKLIGNYIWLDAGESYDKDQEGGIVKYVWNFEKPVWLMGQTLKEIILKEPKMEIKFLQTGKQKINLKVIDDLGGEDEYSLIIEVERAMNNVDLSKIYLKQFLPNPIGPDNEEEWIEICSELKIDVDLAGFILDDQAGGSKPFNLDNYVLPAEDCLKIFRKESNLALNNNHDSVRLFAGQQLLAEVNYEEAAEGYVYQKDDMDKWHWLFYGGEAYNQPMENYSLALNNLGEINNIPEGALVEATGQVATEPGLLGKTIFYIIDNTGGVQIYSYQKDFPLLAIGDLVKIRGIVGNYQGETRVKISNHQDIVNLGQVEILAPINVQIEDIGEEIEGSLVKIRGELTEKKGSTWWLDDKTDEVKIYIKRNTHIKSNDLVVGDSLEIIGLVSEYQGEYRILPRTPNDVKVVGRVLGEAVEQVDNKLDSREISEWLKYVIAILVALIIILLSIIIKIKFRLSNQSK